MRFKFLCVLALLLSGINIGTHPPVVHATGCDDLKIIFARGSGESLNGPSFQAWRSEISAELGATPFSYGFYELGSSRQNGYQYPAVSVSDSLAGVSNLLGAFISRGSWFNFGASVEEGAQELKAYLAQTSAACPNTKYVLGGYSQGAMVISSVLDELDANHIIYVATFGDPKLYLPEGRPYNLARTKKLPDACQGKNLSSYREYVPDCRAYEGVLGSFRPYQPEPYAGKLGTWCNQNDIMCSSGVSVADHTAYAANNLYRDAATIIGRKVRLAFLNQFGNILSFARAPLHEVAIIIDATGSMQGMIADYKAEAKKLATRIKASGGKVALFKYRDLQQGFYPKQLCDFSCTLEDFDHQLSAITAGDGGDDAESALSAINLALNSLDWTNGATKSVVLLTDAGYHNPDFDTTTLAQIVKRSLEIDPVNIYILTNSATKSQYATLAAATGGAVFDIATGLELSTETILSRPVAKLSLASYEGEIGKEFTFDASSSYDQNGDSLTFDWDLDGDGDFEVSNASAIITKTFTSTFHDYIQVRVRNSAGFSSTMSAQVTVHPTSYTYGPLATISNLQIKQSDGGARISFTTDAEKVLLLVDDAPLGFIMPNSRRADFTLTDLATETSVTLVPYLNSERGISESFTITSSPSTDRNIDSVATPTNQPTLPLKAPDTGTCN